MARRRSRRRRGADPLMPVLVGVAVLAALGALARAVARYWPVLVVLAVLAAVGVWLWFAHARAQARLRAARLAVLRLTLRELDALTPGGFEDAVRDLFRRDGFTARRVGGRGDQAADVIADDPSSGRRWMVQCKHTRTGARVGVRVLYEVNGTGDAHGAQEMAIVTNGGFTADARAWASPRGIHLIDRDALSRWAASGHPIAGLAGVPGPSADLDR